MKRIPKRLDTMSKERRLMLERGYMAASEVARRIGRCPSSIYRMIGVGNLRGLQIGCHWYVEVSSLLAYLGPTYNLILNFTEDELAFLQIEKAQREQIFDLCKKHSK